VHPEVRAYDKSEEAEALQWVADADQLLMRADAIHTTLRPQAMKIGSGGGNGKGIV
jgi:hypothetical protein